VSVVEEFKVAPIKPPIAIADVEKLDVRVGTIVAVADVPKSDKLLKLKIDFGDHRRTILAGMKQERENPQEIVGRQALFIVNLEPKRMAGEVSEGMLFDIGFLDGITLCWRFRIGRCRTESGLVDAPDVALTRR
jgi:tRNA-binding protein